MIQQFNGNIGTRTHHGTVTATFMGVSHGDPNWDDVRQVLTLRNIKVFILHSPVETDTPSYPTRLVYHVHIGLMFLTNQLYQQWNAAEAAFIGRPSNMGMACGAYGHSVRAKHKGNDSQLWTYMRYSSTGKSPIFKSMATLYETSTNLANSLTI